MTTFRRTCLWWRECFVENPLLTRETGIGKGRPFWKSPMRWAVYLTLIVQVTQATATLRYWLFGLRVSLSNASSGLGMEAWNAAQGDWLIGSLRLGSSLVFFLIMALPIWASARAWKREERLESKHELGVTGITTQQIVAARVFVWLAVFLIYGIASTTRNLTTDIVLWNLTPHDSLAGMFYGRLTPYMRDDFGYYHDWMQWNIAWFSSDILNQITRHTCLGALLLGILARGILRGWPPMITSVCLAALFVISAGWGDQYTHRLSQWMGMEAVRRWDVNSMSMCVLEELLSIFKSLVFLTVAFFLWRRLPRRVAEAYGMEK